LLDSNVAHGRAENKIFLITAESAASPWHNFDEVKLVGGVKAHAIKHSDGYTSKEELAPVLPTVSRLDP
jgi:hypothetical protein